MISIGDHKTRKKDVLEKMYRQELTKSAMKMVEKKRGLRTGSTEDGLWDSVNRTVEERVEKDLKQREEAVASEADTELESPMSYGEWISYMPIQGSSNSSVPDQMRLNLPRITTTTTTNHGPNGVSTTTMTRIS